jgi:hypothetical protein
LLVSGSSLASLFAPLDKPIPGQRKTGRKEVVLNSTAPPKPQPPKAEKKVNGAAENTKPETSNTKASFTQGEGQGHGQEAISGNVKLGSASSVPANGSRPTRHSVPEPGPTGGPPQHDEITNQCFISVRRRFSSPNISPLTHDPLIPRSQVMSTKASSVYTL